MISEPTTMADLFTQMAHEHYRKTAAMTVRASDSYLMGKTAAHSPYLDFEMIVGGVTKTASYSPLSESVGYVVPYGSTPTEGMSKVASGYVRYLEKLSQTDPERAYYLAKEAGIGSFLGKVVGTGVRGARAAAGGVARGAGAAAGGVARGAGAVARGAGAVKHTMRPGMFNRMGQGVRQRVVNPLQQRASAARGGLGQKWSGIKRNIRTGYRKGRGTAVTPANVPTAAPKSLQQSLMPSGGMGASSAIGSKPITSSFKTAPTGVQNSLLPQKGLDVNYSRINPKTGKPITMEGPGGVATPEAQRRIQQPTGGKGPYHTPGGTPPDPTPPAAPASATPTKAPDTPAAQAAPETPGASATPAASTPSTNANPTQAEVAAAPWKFPWLKAGLMAGAVGVPMVAMKGMDTAQSVLGSQNVPTHQYGRGAPQHWNQSWQF